MSAEVCRMCGEMTESGVWLLDPANRKLAQCIVSKFKYLISTNSKFSSYICGDCAENVESWMYFLERCKKSQTLFTNMVATENLKNKDEPTTSSLDNVVPEIKQEPDAASSCVNSCPINKEKRYEDPLLTANELQIAAKFSELKVASVPVIRLNHTDIRTKCKDGISSRSQEEKFQCHLCKNEYIRRKHLQNHLNKVHHLSKEELMKFCPIYQCKYCDKIFNMPSLLKIHEGCHTLPFKCDICDKRFGKKYILSEHKLIHTAPSFRCQHCGKKFKQKGNLAHHIKSQHSGGVCNYKCEKCDNKFKTKQCLNLHIKIVHTLSKKLLWKCNQCRKCFKMNSYLRKHIKNVHTSYKTLSWKCNQCGKSFKLKKNLRQHKNNIHQGFKFSCYHCGKIFKQKPHLKVHLETQHNGDVRNYKCDQCPSKFKSQDVLSNHIKNCHIVYNELKWKCEICGKCFKFKHYLKKHLATFHIEARYSCFHCNNKFKQKGHLKRHIETQHNGGVRNYKCDQCPLKFNRKDVLSNHIKLCHIVCNELKWKCEICGKCFKVEHYLKKHLATFHIEAKYLCFHCGNKFKQKENLKRHIETQHNGGVRNYKCDQCPSKFKSKYVLSNHIELCHIVYNELTWKFELCDKCFKIKEYLRKHMAYCHQEAKYCCSFCKRNFRHKSSLKVHIRTFHN